MARLRCPLQLLLLLTVAVVAWHDLEHWNECGITKMCIVHKSCYGTKYAGTRGWIETRNIGVYKQAKAPEGYRNADCKRWIVLSPELGGKSLKITMRAETVDKKIGMRFYFKKKGGSSNAHPHLYCNERDKVELGDGDVGVDIENSFPKDSFDEKGVHCIALLRLRQHDGDDIRARIQALTEGRFEVACEQDGSETRYKVEFVNANGIASQQVNLNRIKMPCKAEQVSALARLYDADHDVEFQLHNMHNITDPTPIHPTYGQPWLEEKDTVKCPPGIPLRYKRAKGAALNEYAWEYFKDGLICLRGYLTRAVKDGQSHHDNKRVDSGDSVKCSQKICAVCDPPPLHYLAGAPHQDEAPLYDPAVDGNGCRTLSCPTYMTVKIKNRDNSSILLRQKSISCSTKNNYTNNVLTRGWEIWDDGRDSSRGELIEALCTDDAYCTRMHPLTKGTCEGGKENKTCYEPYILDREDPKTPPCPADFDIIHIATEGTKTLLIKFKCDVGSGKWEAKNVYNHDVPIPDHSTLLCVRKEKDVAAPLASNMNPFVVGSVAFFVFTGGMSLLVVAVVVGSAFYIHRAKKRKSAKKKAMEEVSVTYKEQPKYKNNRSERKKKAQSIPNSVPGTPITPNSMSGPATPMATTPSSAPFSPAVLDLKTGKSRGLKWTNHTGDGPPTENQPKENWATSGSKMDDDKSVKSIPSELSAKKNERKKSRQSEDNLGDSTTKKEERSERSNLDESHTSK